MPEQTGLAVRKTIVVDAAPDVAFRVFTEEIGTWWPLATHSLSGQHAVAVVIEGRIGGRVYERSDAGEELSWGSITAWDPPALFAMTWQLDRDPAEATDLEVRFTAEGSGTRVDLVHSGWERRGDEAMASVESYSGGWDGILGRYTEATVGRK